MIRINNIRVPLDFDLDTLFDFIQKKLNLKSSEILSVTLAKKSVDARKKNNVHFLISADVNATNEKFILSKNKNAIKTEPYIYEITKVFKPEKRPVVVGFGPAGIFSALVLAESGACPIVIERGCDVDTRKNDVENFWNTGVLSEKSNVQFGEGGAGTFSDGKLTTGIKDKRVRFVFEQLVRFGAPEEILYLAKPHIGTDNLCKVVKNIREHIISLGGEVFFESCLTDIKIENDEISAITITNADGTFEIDANKVIFAGGHSSRDTFQLLFDKKLKMSKKNFAVGVRIEHLKKDIDKALYGDFATHPKLKSADYKLVSHLKNGRSLYTFCMCPGGYVVGASSEKEQLTVNGMSEYARDGENSNSALLIGICPEDFTDSHPLAGMYFQNEIEKKAFIAGGSDYSAPIIRVQDFLEHKTSTKLGKVKPTCKPNTKFASPDEYLPDFMCETLRLGIPEMAKKIKCFDDKDAILTGVESRSSSPVRIERNENFCSVNLNGFYPCGEGAGYAGGITSASVDGIKCAEALIKSLED